MIEPLTLVRFALAALILIVIPGPAVLYIVSRSIHQGRRAGLLSVLGVQVGATVQLAAVAVGLSAILVASVTAFTVVKFAGAAYLIVLGIRTLRSRDNEPDHAIGTVHSLQRIFAEGVVVEALNPKTAIFFLAFLPQFVDADRGAALVQVAVLGVVWVALALVSDGAYALLAAHAGAWLRARAGFVGWQRRISGCIYLALGVAAAFTGRRPSNA